MTELSQSNAIPVEYRLRSINGRYMIDKLVGDNDFDPPIMERRQSFGPFPTRESARRFMLRHGERP